MRKLRWSAAWLALLAIVAAAISSSQPVRAEGPTAATGQPVEKSMHEFMEYLFQPTYKRLKPAMAAAPADNAGWKAIKADSLILAEGGNLLLMHTPKEDGAAWDEMSGAVRESGAALYQAARKKDYPTARQHYETMLKKCNACHDKFADGEHQLAP
ncbi:MAG TPA: hypothetical protein VGE52_21265 [Pirellulales bacterium]